MGKLSEEYKTAILLYMSERPLTYVGSFQIIAHLGKANTGGAFKTAWQSLKKHEYIERHPDQRYVKYKITEKGLATVNRIIPLVHQGWEWACPNCFVHTSMDHVPDTRAVKCDICGGCFVVKEDGPYSVPSSAVTDADIEKMQEIAITSLSQNRK